MNEAEFKYELYRQLKNNLEKYENHNLKIKPEVPLGYVSRERKPSRGSADIVIYYKDEPILILEAKNNKGKLSAAVTQVYRYAFTQLSPVENRFVAVCSPDALELYEYDLDLAKITTLPSEDFEEGIFISEEGGFLSLPKEAKRRLIEKHEFENESVPEIAEKMLVFLKGKDMLN